MVLVGIVVFSEKNTEVIQLFAENINEEVNILKSLIEILNEKKLIFTYNGHSFDIPYLNHKYRINGIDYQIPMYYDFDILRVSRANRTYLNLPDYKLKTIEKFLGIERKDTISGKESVEMYFDYVNTKDPTLKNKILLHNYEDILNIVDLFSIFSFCKQPTIYKEFKYPIEIYNFEGNSSFDRNFYVKLGLSKSFEELKFYLIDYKMKENIFTCIFDSNALFSMEFIYEKEGLKLSMEDGLVKLTLPMLSFAIDEVEYMFIDIDTIYGNGSFNKLNSNDKLKLNISAKQSINPQKIIGFLKDNLYTIINRLIS